MYKSAIVVGLLLSWLITPNGYLCMRTCDDTIYVPKEVPSVYRYSSRGATVRRSSKPEVPKKTLFELSKGNINTFDLRTSSGLDAKQLENGLQRNLRGKAELMIKYEETYQINSLFIAAVCALESSWGSSDWAKQRHNYFGYGNRRFNSFEDSLKAFCGAIHTEYLTKDGAWFNGYTVSSVNIRYCTNPQWAAKVKQLMLQIYKEATE